MDIRIELVFEEFAAISILLPIESTNEKKNLTGSARNL
jgi:hypothetical protein